MKTYHCQLIVGATGRLQNIVQNIYAEGFSQAAEKFILSLGWYTQSNWTYIVKVSDGTETFTFTAAMRQKSYVDVRWQRDAK